MDERRTRKRVYMMFYSRIRDRHSGDLIGHLVDLTSSGMLVVSETPVEVGQVLFMQMELPEDVSEKQFLKFDAQTAWCRRDVDPSFYDIGFQLVDISPEDNEIIKHFIETYGFREH
jgi:hypothetical protein